jgi:uncharacterized membrane protein (UPF0127 family)
MSGVRVTNTRNNLVVLSDLREARGVWQRFAGLMLRPSLASGHGLLFRPARGLHTHFMRFAIDLIYLDERDRVQAVRAAMPPWRFDGRSAAAVIEANAGTITAADLRVGDQVRFEAG